MRRSLSSLLVCYILMAGVASAKTWYVDPGGGGDATTIEAGIDSASAGDTVSVACGTYYEHGISVKSGVYLTSETGTADCVTIDAGDNGRVFNCVGADTTTAVVGFTATNGEILGDCGGGMYCRVSDIKVTNCDFHDNYTDSLGGGVYVRQCSPTFANCEFTGNIATEAMHCAGGGVYVFAGSPTFTGCVFADNDATWGDGGGLYCRYGGTSPVITGCTFEANRGNWGVALALATDGGNPVVHDCTFLDNDGGQGGVLACNGCGVGISDCWFEGGDVCYGGGISQIGDSVITVTRCTFVDNWALSMGGAFIVEFGGAVFTDCEFVGNASDHSGGAGQVVFDAWATFDSCLFAENICTDRATARVGGGLAVRDNSRADLSNCTISGNTAGDRGGGVSFQDHSTGSFDRCIIAYSRFGDGIEWDETGAEPFLTCTDIYGNAAGDWAGPLASQLGTDGNISEDPLFCHRAGNDYRLGAASPCLDADTCGTLGAYGQGCLHPSFGIEFVTDWREDHGGYVNVSWYPHEYDGAAGDTVVDYYTVWRRGDGLGAVSYPERGVWPGWVGQPPGSWERVDSVAASSQSKYVSACPTKQDSTWEGLPWSVYFVRAHSSGAYAEYDTPPDSGYSVWDVVGWTDVTTGPLTDTAWGHGFSWVDFDNDQDLDIFYNNRDSENRLFRNDSLTAEGFTDATPSVLADPGDCRGIAWGDYDKDGDLDLYVSRNGANTLFRNDGGGSFTDVTASPLDDAGIGQSVSWVDYDNDGDVDLYLVNNGANRLFRNDGSGVFTDVTPAPLADSYQGLGSSWADYDSDGDMDLYLANYGNANRLVENQGDGNFVDVTPTALEMPGNSMGVSWGDYDNDGDPDLYVTGEGDNKLFRNDGGSFTDVSSFPVDDYGHGRTGAWGDFDLDGDLDIYLVNDFGPSKLFRNKGGGVFARADSGGCPLTDQGVGFSTAWGDYDKDGDLDLFLVKNGGNRLYRNDLPPGLHWLEVRLAGDASDSYGYGARVRIVAGGLVQTREIRGGGGYLSQGPLTAFFGLGTATTVDTVQVDWPCSGTEILTGVACDRKIVVYEGQSGLDDDVNNPRVFRLYAARPNPFSGLTAIRYDLPERAEVALKIYDISGRLVRTLVDGVATDPGRHTARWNGRNSEGKAVAPGVYFCRLSTGRRTGLQRIVLLR